MFFRYLFFRLKKDIALLTEQREKAKQDKPQPYVSKKGGKWKIDEENCLRFRQKYSSILMHVPHTRFLLKTLHTSFSSHVILLPLLLLLSCFIYLYQLILFSEVVSGTFKHNTGFSAHIHSPSDNSFLDTIASVSLYFIPHFNTASTLFSQLSFSSMKSLQCFELFFWISHNADYSYFIGKGSVRETQAYWCTMYIAEIGRSIQYRTSGLDC